jgi:hypothetical protein
MSIGAKQSAGAFTKLRGYITQRDPNEGALRLQWQSLESFKRTAGVFGGAVLFIWAMRREQLQHPETVRVPRMDGRSLVT